MAWQAIDLAQACPASSSLTACSPFGFLFLNILVQLYADSNDRRIQQELGYNNQPNNNEARVDFDDEEYDFILVGLGSAGAVVANRLSAIRDWSILVLEAGSEQADVTLIPGLSNALLGSNIDYGYSTMPDNKSCLAREDGRCPWPRGKVMGGSSSLNSFAYIRGNKEDYDDWAAMGNEGWSYDDLLPYFKKIEKTLDIDYSDEPSGQQSSQMLEEALLEKGLLSSTPQVRSTIKNGLKVSSNNAYIQSIRYNRRNLVVRTNVQVRQIILDANRRAIGVSYVWNEVFIRSYATREVIISGGSTNSPKLLMASGIGPKEHLEELNIPVHKDLPVGENLHDHVTLTGIVIALPDGTTTTVSKEEILKQIVDFKDSEVKNGPLSKPVSGIGFIYTQPDLPIPDIQYEINNVNWEEFIKDPINYEKLNIFPTSDYNGLVVRPSVLEIESRGKLLLNPSDPSGNPMIYANYFGDEADLDRMVAGVRQILNLEETEAFKSRGAYFVKTPLPACKDFEWGTDQYIRCIARSYTSGTYHSAGSCKMGPIEDNTAVVDSRLRVHGITGLRVIDASIMPVVNRGNSNAASLLIGEKGAAMLIEDWLNKAVNK